MYRLIEPKTDAELQQYYSFRWTMLRKPLGLPPGSERDEFESHAHHRMLIDEHGDPCAVGRIYQLSADEAQIRHVAVDPERRSEGLGTRLIEALEAQARELGVRRIVMNARMQSISFFASLGYQQVGEGPSHFGKIKHQQMIKELPPLGSIERHVQWCQDLENHLLASNPLAAAIGLRVHGYTAGRLELRLPAIDEASGHAGLFAGAAFSLATLTGYGLIWLLARSTDLLVDTRLEQGQIWMEQPLQGEPLARAQRGEVGVPLIKVLRSTGGGLVPAQVTIVGADGGRWLFSGHYRVAVVGPFNLAAEEQKTQLGLGL